MGTDKPRDAKELLARLADFMRHCDSISSADTDGILRDLGYDPELIGKMGRDMAAASFNRQKQVERESLKQQRLAAQKSAANWKPETPYLTSEIDAAIKDIMAGKHGQSLQTRAMAFNHNFKQATVEDKISLLKDLGILAKLFPKANSK